MSWQVSDNTFDRKHVDNVFLKLFTPVLSFAEGEEGRQTDKEECVCEWVSQTDWLTVCVRVSKCMWVISVCDWVIVCEWVSESVYVRESVRKCE